MSARAIVLGLFCAIAGFFEIIKKSKDLGVPSVFGLGRQSIQGGWFWWHSSQGKEDTEEKVMSWELGYILPMGLI